MTERFIFGVPLIARAASRDWNMVERLLELTLRSVLAQRDQDFRLVLASHDEPACWRALATGDPRFVRLQADWPAEAPDSANNDGGRKKALVKGWMREAGGGLLMFLDADDWVDRDLVRSARAAIGPEHVGGLVAHGVAVDVASGRAARFPVPGAWDGPFHGLCGSSTVARVRPGGTEWIERDPNLILGPHGEWEARAAAGHHQLARLDVWGAYLVGAGQSHSETYGPFAEWRRDFSAAVRRAGAPLDVATAARFGVTLAGFAGLRGSLAIASC